MLVNKLLSITPKHFVKYVCASKFCTDPSQDVINMAFASYESTLTYPVDPPTPLVVMHGLLGSKANWNSLCKAFHRHTNPKRKIIAVDARNHGDSPHCNSHTYPHLAEDIKLLYAQQKIKRSCLLGHSMGGRAMMYFALKYPNFVDKLIIGDVSPITSSPNLRSMPTLFSAIQKVQLPSHIPMSSARLNADIQLAKNISDRGLRAFLLTNLIQKTDGSFMWRVNIPALLSNFYDHIASFPIPAECKFTGPVLFVAGGVSDFIQKTDHSQILNLFPNAEFQVIEGAGHWLHSEKPNEFLQICIEFLNRNTVANEKK
ncbi:hypothetical protein PPYR_12051 [Photinus pyralis]|uniref:sn-1-specific diacylglycerol lipase ABHD11 n=2 Tax=Photinus pyralis TaxID=7054 RepID=A0A1Y1KDI7_PHOPY|nr:protein ABHD11-like [Photinus pyralis]XP_031351967.1 protein ABHD11-like [Photinus pyralis]KAB0794734.1 hypothetical protein PPYR_11573 [Photinus pyralis]KAB0795212.1 hypothetical protein PPYR_12051 [Photinus pyralis]